MGFQNKWILLARNCGSYNFLAIPRSCALFREIREQLRTIPRNTRTVAHYSAKYENSCTLFREIQEQLRTIPRNTRTVAHYSAEYENSCALFRATEIRLETLILPLSYLLLCFRSIIFTLFPYST